MLGCYPESLWRVPQPACQGRLAGIGRCQWSAVARGRRRYTSPCCWGYSWPCPPPSRWPASAGGSHSPVAHGDGGGKGVQPQLKVAGGMGRPLIFACNVAVVTDSVALERFVTYVARLSGAEGTPVPPASSSEPGDQLARPCSGRGAGDWGPWSRCSGICQPFQSAAGWSLAVFGLFADVVNNHPLIPPKDVDA